jgi:hypothetical protein
LDIEWREEKRERKRLRERGVLSGAGEEDEMGCTAGRETHTHTHTNPHYMYTLLSCNLSHVRFDLVGEMR